jgi:competence protein ComEC
VLGNLLAMPIMGFVVMPAAALSVMAMPFHLEAGPLHVMDFGITLMLEAGGWVSGLPGAVSPVAAWPMAALVVLSLGGLWILIWRGRWRWLGLLPLAGAVIFAMLARGPDLLVASDAATVAMRGNDGKLGFVGKVRDAYAADEWLERDGDAGPRQIAPARCDGWGCVLRSKGGIIAISQRYEALADDCANAAIVIAAFDVRDCTGPKLVIDRSRAMRDGAYAIRLSPLRVESVAQARGKRPWSQ